eukprot:scaffold12479_cov51-Phaeocystis_antarctica.AAC.3
MWISGRDPALDYLAETIIMVVEAVALSVKHSNQLQLKLWYLIARVSLSSRVYPPTPVRNASVINISQKNNTRGGIPAAGARRRTGRDVWRGLLVHPSVAVLPTPSTLPVGDAMDYVSDNFGEMPMSSVRCSMEVLSVRLFCQAVAVATVPTDIVTVTTGRQLCRRARKSSGAPN